jgi:phosphate transport system substrate-binding protein
LCGEKLAQVITAVPEQEVFKAADVYKAQVAYIPPPQAVAAVAKKAKPSLLVRVGSVAFAAVSTGMLLLVLGLVISPKWLGLSHLNQSAEARGTQNIILQLSGSEVIGDNLVPALAAAFLKQQGASDVRIIPGDKRQEVIVQGILPGDNFTSAIDISAHGTASAFTSLADSSCDIGMASRRIKSDEASKLSSLGEMFSRASEHVVALDGVAVIVNASNPIGELSKDDVVRIFTGKMANWPKAASSQGAIRIYAENDNSETYDTFKDLALGDKPLAASVQRVEDGNSLSEAVASDQNGIGFVGLPYIHAAKPIAVSDKGAQALLPTRLTVATESYVFSRRLYLYTPSNPANKFTRKFIEFALSKQGQDVVAANGFVAQNLGTEKQTASKDATDEYLQLTDNSQRLSADLRFENGALAPDSKAEDDLDRIVSLIADQKLNGNKIMLFGFSESGGNPQNSVAQSLDRAKFVEKEFARRGLKPVAVRGFGAIFPVATNDSEEGRLKNRRVEIWVRN